MSDLTQRAARIAELAAKATPGPWSVFGDVNSIAAHGARFKATSSAFGDYLTENLLHCETAYSAAFRRSEDADFIASAHEMAQLIADQAARIAELERDAARLTHLEDEDLQVRVEAVYFGTDDADPKWVILDFDGDPIAESEHGLREAIDAAMRGSVDANT